MTRIKICGITNLADGRCAAEAGADFLGFVFYPKSPRYVEPAAAGEITAILREEFGDNAPRMVGVFVDEPPQGVRAILDEAGLDVAQLHGSEPPAELRALHPRAFKAIRPQSRGDAEAMIASFYDVVPDVEDLPQFLIDAYHPWKFGGTGEMTDLAVAKLIAGRFRLLLAGGLTPETVGPAIERVRPWGVDVSSGVEREKGAKDHEKVRAFVAAAREADAVLEDAS